MFHRKYIFKPSKKPARHVSLPEGSLQGGEPFRAEQVINFGVLHGYCKGVRHGSDRNYIVSKLVYNLFTGLTTYCLYRGDLIHLLISMDIPVAPINGLINK